MEAQLARAVRPATEKAAVDTADSPDTERPPANPLAAELSELPAETDPCTERESPRRLVPLALCEEPKKDAAKMDADEPRRVWPLTVISPFATSVERTETAEPAITLPATLTESER